MDAVITYVNGTDKLWISDYNKYVKKPLEENRYRDWGTLSYLIKGIRKFMPFVKNIFLVVSGVSQVPEEIDTTDVNVVLHRMIMPEKYLPCFNSCTIEMFLHNIPGLDEEFIYFNDDTFVIKPAKATDFFIDGKPVLSPIIKTMSPFDTFSVFQENCVNATKLIRDKFVPTYPANIYIRQQHIMRPMLKSTYKKVWDKCAVEICKSLTRTRHNRNCNAYLFNNYDYMTGNYVLKELNYKYIKTTNHINDILGIIESSSYVYCCINDTGDANFENKNKIHTAFNNILNIEYKVNHSSYSDKILYSDLLKNSSTNDIDINDFLIEDRVYKKHEYLCKFELDYEFFISALSKMPCDVDLTGKQYNNEKAVISLTTWKNRVNTVSKTLYSLLLQCPNFHIVLVLSEDEFPQKEHDLPFELLLFIRHKLIEILWIKENVKAYKKVIYTINKYKEVPVISADDDCVYLYNYAEKFYETWKQNKECFVSCWSSIINGITHTAGAATLYPPYVFGNTAIKCLSQQIIDFTNQDDDYYTEIKRLLNLNNAIVVGNHQTTYLFHDEINPLHDEIKLIKKDVLHDFLWEQINKNNKQIIVSMTSYPKRIHNVATSIKLLLNKQILVPDQIHLWLCKEEFPNKETDLPNDLIEVISNNENVILHWLDKNTYAHKRHEIFNVCPKNSFVFFIDDDVEYDKWLIERCTYIGNSNPGNIVLYNKYSLHKYDGKRIIYTPNKVNPAYESCVNKFRWCGQSMIPYEVYPKEILDNEHQKMRDIISPVCDESWVTPWLVYHNIPMIACTFGWGTDIDENVGKDTGLVSWTHDIEENGYERRDNWLYAVLKAYPELYDKYQRLFNYDK